MNDVHRQVVEALEGAVLLIDPEGQVVFANDDASRLLGGQITGTRLDTARFENDPPLLELVARVYRQAALESGRGSELVVTTDESGSRFHLVTVSGARDGAGLMGRLVLVVDVGEPLMETAAIRKVFSQISHDLRSPLTSIAGAAELLLSGRVGGLEPVQRRLVTIVEEGGRKITEILGKTKSDLVRAGTVGGDAGE